MSSPQDQALISLLNSVNIQMQLYFSYTAPWIGLALSTFAILALVLRKRRESNLLIYIFVWNYAIGIIYPLNMAFNDPQFSQRIFGYTFKQAVSDPVCKLSNMFAKFFYCASPWMQVLITFDRLWSVYLENRLRIKRNKISVTILILIVLSFVLVVNQVHMAYYVQNSKISVQVFNATLNKTVSVIMPTAVCIQPNSQLVLAQDMLFVIMRIVLPFIIMVVCNVILINHIRESRSRVIRGRKEKKEHSFTMAVAIMNGSFLVCNIGVVAYYIMVYYLRFSGTSLSSLSLFITSFYGTCAILFSYIFTLSQFLVDMIFNKVFRKEILIAFLFLTGRGNQVEPSRGATTQANNSTTN